MLENKKQFLNPLYNKGEFSEDVEPCCSYSEDLCNPFQAEEADVCQCVKILRLRHAFRDVYLIKSANVTY